MTDEEVTEARKTGMGTLPTRSTGYDAVFIDAMNLAARSYHGIRTSYQGKRTGTAVGFLRMLMSIWRRWGSRDTPRIVFLWEGRQSNEWRRDIDPFYKAQRLSSGSKRDFIESVQEVKPILQSLGIRQVQVDGFEADDLAGWLVDSLVDRDRILLVSNDEDRILLVSNDEDWFQYLVPDRVDIVRHGLEVETYQDIRDQVGYPPERVWLLKALRGDSADNIPPIDNVQKKSRSGRRRLFPERLAKSLLSTCGSPEDILNLAQSAEGAIRDGDEDWGLVLLRQRYRFERNTQLTRWRPLSDEDEVEMAESRWNLTRATKELEKLGMVRMIEELRALIEEIG